MNTFLKNLVIIAVLSPISLLHAQPKIGISKAFWEFGKVQKGSVINESLIIKNKGDTPLKITARSIQKKMAQHEC